MTDHAPNTLAEAWRQLWNGDLDRLDDVVDDAIVIHAAVLGGGEGFAGRAALGEWIANLHAMVDELGFDLDVGPIATTDHLVLRWRAHGRYRGGMPGVADAAAGRRIDFTGTDILRILDGRIVEYWVNSDMHILTQQLA